MSEITNEIVKAEQTELTEQNAKPGALDFLSGDALNKAYKNAKIIASSDLMPDTYKNRPENVLIAMDLANRTNFGLMTIMQNLYIVKGKPSWAGQFCKAAIDGCGKYSDTQYVWVGEPGTMEYGCYLQATEAKTGRVVKGTTVNWTMVKAYGWDSKPGSQWKSNPEQMFKYRAAAYFARTECPSVLQGLQTADEVRDAMGYDEPKKQKTRVTLNSVKPDVVVDSEVEDA